MTEPLKLPVDGSQDEAVREVHVLETLFVPAHSVIVHAAVEVLSVTAQYRVVV